MHPALLLAVVIVLAILLFMVFKKYSSCETYCSSCMDNTQLSQGMAQDIPNLS
jgi:hypothetical protein